MKKDDLKIVTMYLKQRFSELQNSLSELSGQQKKDCILLMLEINQVLEKVGK